MATAKRERGANSAPKTHHIDRRADQVLAAGNGDDDDMLNTLQVAAWLGCSTQWLEIGRVRGYGPEFIRFGERSIRYRKGNVRKWLRERTFASTTQYDGRKPAEVA